MDRLLLVCLGGAIGSGLRYLTATVTARVLGLDFPFGTLAVNLVGAFGIGVIQEVAAVRLLTEPGRLFLTAGLMGGLTTYSAFTYETISLAQVGAWHRAWLNVVVTTAACLLLCVLGMAAGRSLVALRG